MKYPSKKTRRHPGVYINPEDALQIEFCKVLDAMKLLYYSIPNGTYKPSKFVQDLYKKTGLKEGAPDLHIPVHVLFNNGDVQYSSLYIETKTPKGTVSSKQKIFHEDLRVYGHRVEVVRSVDQLIKLMRECYPAQYEKARPRLQLLALQNNTGKK
jgi:hypothetical protein